MIALVMALQAMALQVMVRSPWGADHRSLVMGPLVMSRLALLAGAPRKGPADDAMLCPEFAC